jgi:hypothetical protein
MAVVVKKWRKINNIPFMIGSISRDCPVRVFTCNNILPVLGGIDTTLIQGYTPTNTNYSCFFSKDSLISFNIYGYDADSTGSNGTFKIGWNEGIPNGFFTTYNNNTNTAYSNLTLAPGPGTLINYPYYFNLTISDNSCPKNGVNVIPYCLYIISHQVDIGRDTMLCQGEELLVRAKTDTLVSNYIWKIDGINLTVPLTSDTLLLNTSGLTHGKHYLSVEVNNGSSSPVYTAFDTLIIDIVYQPKINLPSDTLLCGKPLFLDAGPGTLHYWSIGSYSQTITIQPPFTGMVWVGVDGGQSTRCVDMDTIMVEILPGIQSELGEITGPVVSPPYSEVQYTTSLNPVADKNWKVSGGVILGSLTSDTILIRWFPMETGKVMLEIVKNNICYAYDTLDVIIGYVGIHEAGTSSYFVYPNPASSIINFELDNSKSCEIEISDISGRKLDRFLSGSSHEQIDISSYAAGLYFYHIRSSSGKLLAGGKFIVDR